MSRSDRPGRRRPHLGELFVDRETESAAFKETLVRFRRGLDQDDDVGDAQHNVLVYYGMGGIGKTELTRRLESWAKNQLSLQAGWGPPPPTRVDVTARFDFHDSAGQVDILAILVALRSGLAHHRRRWPAFDLAFAAYWSAVRPGEALPQFAGPDGEAVVGLVKDALGDLAGTVDLTAGTFIGLGVNAVKALLNQLRRQQDLKLATSAYPGFEMFLLRCADEPGSGNPRPDLACEIAELLSWEIGQMQPAPLIVTFLDAFERLTSEDHPVGERYLNELIYSLPNVLFVIGGRNVLDWHDARRLDLPHRGAAVWPGLVPGAPDNPRQHLVGRLSGTDARALINEARRSLDLPITDEVVEELVVSSDGLPQYLELARQFAISVKDSGSGDLVRVEDVTGSLRSLVMRLLDGVPDDEQRVLRTACLFTSFDIELLTLATPADHGTVQRAVERLIVDYFPDQRFPYRIHDSIRGAIREAGHDFPGAWAEADWQLASTRAAAAAYKLREDAQKREDYRGVLLAVAIAIRLVCEQPTELAASTSHNYDDWLAQAIVYAPSVQGLRPLIPATSKTEYGQRILDFIAAKSMETPVPERIRLLREIFDSDHAMSLPAGRHLGYAYRNQQRWDEALAVFAEVIERAPTQVNLRQGPLTLSLARRFGEAIEAARRLDVKSSLYRTIEYAHGRPERYFAEIEPKFVTLQKDSRHRELLEDFGDYLVRRALLRGDVSLTETTEFIETAEGVGHKVAVRSGLCATILMGESPDVEAMLVRLKALDQEALSGRIGFKFAVAEFCDALVREDRQRLVSLHEAAAAYPIRSRAWVPVDFFLARVGLPLPPVEAQWQEPVETIEERWNSHLDAYLRRRGVEVQ